MIAQLVRILVWLASPWLVGGAIIAANGFPGVGLMVAICGTGGLVLLVAFLRGAHAEPPAPPQPGDPAEPTSESSRSSAAQD